MARVEALVDISGQTSSAAPHTESFEALNARLEESRIAGNQNTQAITNKRSASAA